MNPEHDKLERGLANAAWGYLFLHFDFNLGTVSIVPRFVGFLLLLSATRDLSGARRDLSLLRPLAILLAAWNALDWLASWLGRSVDGRVLFLDLLITVVNLYFHFQFLTDMAALAEQYQSEGDNLDRWLLRRRTVYIVLSTTVFVLMYLPAGRFEEQLGFAMTALSVVLLVVAVLIMAALFELRRRFREGQPSA